MPTPTLASVRIAGLLLGGLLCSQGSAHAQTTPAWTRAASTRDYLSIHSGSIRHLDAAGNVYEVGQFSVAASVGRTYLYSQGSYDGYLGKYNADGTTAWVRQFGSAGEDGAADVAFDAAGNAYVVGTYTEALNLGNGVRLDAAPNSGQKVFIAKYAPNGTPLWAQHNDSYPGTMLPTCPPTARVLGVQVDSANHVNVTCVYGLATNFGFGGMLPSTPLPNRSKPGANSVYLARFSATTGTPLSLKPILYISPSVTAGGLAFQQRLLTTPTGGTYLVANYVAAPSFSTGLAFAETASPDVLVAKYNASGLVEWARTFGGPDWDELTDARTDAAGNLYITGSFKQSLRFGSTTLAGAGAEDGFLVKYSPEGVEQWAQSLTSPGADILRGLCVDPAGNAYVTGGYAPQARLGGTALASAGQLDIVVAAFTPKGQLNWLQRAGGTQDDEGFSLGFTAEGRLRVFGYTGTSASFDAIPVYYGYAWAGFVAELAASPQAAPPAEPLEDAPLPGQALQPYPNPATAQLHLPGLAAGTRVQLLDALGRVVRETTVSAAAEVSVQGLAPGMYSLRATDAQSQRYVGRVAVE
ncbi:T9SS type A sorting domain-containing protein [Hymenobacter properus]|uniref:T9SS type A sorting domain-containing protein n=1 Tax=Hymenobacter properus TaxID=2791026 RepID=A0A931BNG2_9BACT|nr:T9SS type A sorting domain-containing protein [Hymenobacter properus]MBF9142645.1 T9SS type A sorting domain-containing protein [Hymenobacter properus]MBR7721453.1 T9SS type A sorting domain-containing protein [Microvirga sp. SRT04]